MNILLNPSLLKHVKGNCLNVMQHILVESITWYQTPFPAVLFALVLDFRGSVLYRSKTTHAFVIEMGKVLQLTKFQNIKPYMSKLFMSCTPSPSSLVAGLKFLEKYLLRGSQIFILVRGVVLFGRVILLGGGRWWNFEN